MMKLLTIVKMNSVWPQTVNFVSPLRVGEIRLEPVIHGERRPIRMQLQIKGNSSPEGKDTKCLWVHDQNLGMPYFILHFTFSKLVESLAMV